MTSHSQARHRFGSRHHTDVAWRHVIQADPIWSLDRIDQAQLPLDDRYLGFADGAGSTVYVLDTGIRATHSELAGRVLPGFTVIADGLGTGDCQGHGTHVAGTIAGTRYGVAKRANVVPVRTFDCTGTSSSTNTLAGLDYVARTHRPSSVLNMSLGGPASTLIDTAVRNLVTAGVVVVASAGNKSVDSCLQSPAREPAAITVGATAETDARAVFSNFGSCVDLFAPGVRILSARYTSDTELEYKDGTSMAAPSVAGVVAAYLSAHPGSTPAQVTAALLAGAASDRVTDLRGSPNRLLQVQFIDAEAPTAGFTYPSDGAIVPTDFTIDATASDPNLARVELMVDDAMRGTFNAPPYRNDVTELAPGSHVLTIKATDLAGRSTTLSITVTVEEPEPELGDVSGGCAGTPGAAGLPFMVLTLALGMRRRRRTR